MFVWLHFLSLTLEANCQGYSDIAWISPEKAFPWVQHSRNQQDASFGSYPGFSSLAQVLLQ
jgi:hypothetical protein